MTTDVPGNSVMNSAHLLIESPRTCIFWQVQLIAIRLGAQLDQTSQPPPHSHNQYKQHETTHSIENKSYSDKSKP